MEQKQQLYIPKCYLKNSATQIRSIWLKDYWSDKIFAQKTTKALRQKNLYRQPVHAESRYDNIIENFFSNEIENSWPALVDSIENERQLSQDEWGNLIIFMISMHVRVPNRLKSIIELLRRSVIEISDKIDEPLPEVLQKVNEKMMNQNSVL